MGKNAENAGVVGFFVEVREVFDEGLVQLYRFLEDWDLTEGLNIVYINLHSVWRCEDFPDQPNFRQRVYCTVFHDFQQRFDILNRLNPFDLKSRWRNNLYFTILPCVFAKIVLSDAGIFDNLQGTLQQKLGVDDLVAGQWDKMGEAILVVSVFPPFFLPDKRFVGCR